MDTMVPAGTQKPLKQRLGNPEPNGTEPDAELERLLASFAIPDMARTARTARAARRRAAPAAWHRELRARVYYDPDYAYDPTHEYAVDWTTDPDCHGDGIDLLEFDKDGNLEPYDDRRTQLEGAMMTMLRRRFGHRVESQARLLFARPVAEELNLRTPTGRFSSLVKPDLMLFPKHRTLPSGIDYRPDNDRFINMRPEPPRLWAWDDPLPPHQDEPPPELVVEILSRSSLHRDLVEKRNLYARLGVREYWLCDVGGILHARSPQGMQILLRSDTGTYEPVHHDPAEPPDELAFTTEPLHSPTCGVRVRLLPDIREPRFLWHDADQGRWRDLDGDAQVAQARRDRNVRDEALTEGREQGLVEGREQGLVEGEVRMAVAVMQGLLDGVLPGADLDRIAAHWRNAGPPADPVGSLRTVQQTPHAWRSLLDIPDKDRGELS